MKRTAAVENEEADSFTETKSLIQNTPKKMSDHEIETPLSLSTTSEEVARQIKADTDPLSEQLTHPCELMRKLRNEQVNRLQEETASSKASRSPSSNAGRSDRDGFIDKRYLDKFHLWAITSFFWADLWTISSYLRPV